jgi:hypothetical protein
MGSLCRAHHRHNCLMLLYVAVFQHVPQATSLTYVLGDLGRNGSASQSASLHSESTNAAAPAAAAVTYPRAEHLVCFTAQRMNVVTKALRAVLRSSERITVGEQRFSGADNC